MSQHHSVSRHEAERMLVRADSDPHTTRHFEPPYSGRHDVRDALWWAAHPLTGTVTSAP